MVFYRIINFILNLVELSIIIEVISSWVMVGRQNKFIMFIHTVTEPILKPARVLQNKISPNSIADFSPFIVLVIILLLRKIMINLLFF